MFDQRPRVDLPPSALDRFLQAAALLGAFVLGGALIAIPTTMPERVPLHFGVSGQPDRWGSPVELMILPTIGIVMWVSLELLARAPHIYNYPVPITMENAPCQYTLARRLVRWLSAALVWFFALLLLETARVASGVRSDLGPAIVFVPLGGIVAVVWYFVAAIRAR
ncbi:MAG: DUF1648 domain-containing protein [Thermoanaerobaculia bacterium]|nr:DUF1648 domain-containing protein [Thermoanaerobaculia bacterium]